MSLGTWIRTRIPPQVFAKLARGYRALFMDATVVVEELDALLPQKCHLLDVGGGDGLLIDLLLRRRPDLQVTMTDLSRNLGSLMEPDTRNRVTFYPGTSLATLLQDPSRRFDAVLLSDVLHHVPAAQRANLVCEARTLLRPSGVLLVKEVSPGMLRSWLGLLADRHISGDRGVQLLPRGEVVSLATACGPVAEVRDSAVFRRDPPNFLLCFSFGTKS